MTRKRWADLRDQHLGTPEAIAAYAAAKVALDGDLAEYEALMKPAPNADPADIQKRRERFEEEHPEWFEDR